MLRLEPMPSVEPLGPTQAEGRLKVIALVGALMAIGNVSAQGLQIRPSVDTRLTYSDNIDASSVNERSDWVAEIAPSLMMMREEGRFTGRLQATLRNVFHARESRRDTSFVELDGNGQLEAIKDRLFIDMDAATSRNNTTGLSGRSSQDFLATDSSDETRRFSIGPRCSSASAIRRRGEPPAHVVRRRRRAAARKRRGIADRSDGPDGVRPLRLGLVLQSHGHQLHRRSDERRHRGNLPRDALSERVAQAAAARPRRLRTERLFGA